MFRHITLCLNLLIYKFAFFNMCTASFNVCAYTFVVCKIKATYLLTYLLILLTRLLCGLVVRTLDDDDQVCWGLRSARLRHRRAELS